MWLSISQTVPLAGRIPSLKYSLIALAVQNDVAVSEQCYIIYQHSNSTDIFYVLLLSFALLLQSLGAVLPSSLHAESRDLKD